MSSLENTKPKQFIDGFVVYKRYVDDIFCVKEENIDLKELVNCFDSAYSNIKFSVEPEFENQPNFLDVTLKRQSDGSIQRSIHRKLKWSGQYSHFSSFVPVKIKKNLIICLTDRVRRLYSEDTVDKELLFLRQVFINNGYPERLLDKCMKQRPQQDKVSLAAKKSVHFVAIQVWYSGWNYLPSTINHGA